MFEGNFEEKVRSSVHSNANMSCLEQIKSGIYVKSFQAKPKIVFFFFSESDSFGFGKKQKQRQAG